MSFLHQFIPIGLLFFFLSNRDEFVGFSQTIWGKVFAVFMILLYTNMDKMFGLFVCSLVILYYQSEWMESFLNMKDLQEWENELLKEVEILVLEIDDRSLNESGNSTKEISDYKIIKIFWEDWLTKSGVKRFELFTKASTKSEVQDHINKFLQINN